MRTLLLLALALPMLAGGAAADELLSVVEDLEGAAHACVAAATSGSVHVAVDTEAMPPVSVEAPDLVAITPVCLAALP